MAASSSQDAVHESLPGDGNARQSDQAQGHHFGSTSINDFARVHLGDSHNTVYYNIAGDYHGPAPTTQQKGSVSGEQKARALIVWLRFARQMRRKENIQPAHRETFEWIFDDSTTASMDSSSVSQWLRTGNGIFWIKGKPGCGKSTMMKMLAEDDRTHQSLLGWNAGSRPLFSSYYFWSQASTLENSDAGLLRSILTDLLGTRPDLCDVAFPDWQPNDAWHDPEFATVSWALKRLLASDALHSKVSVLIDGLDEYANDSMQRTKLVNMISQLSQSNRIKFLISSRPLQEFEETLQSYPHLTVHHFTKGCIRTMVVDSLVSSTQAGEGIYYSDGDLQSLVHDVVEKSAGVFLWAAFAAQTLVDGIAMKDTVFELQGRLAELPPELEELLAFMLRRVPQRYRHEAYKTLRIAHHWHKFVDEPLPTIVLSFACDYETFRKRLGLDGDYMLNDIAQRLKRTEARLRSCCLGMLETSSENSAALMTGETGRPYMAGGSTVQFMHKTVLDYLSDKAAWESITPSDLTTFNVDLAMLVGLVTAMKVESHGQTWQDWMRGVSLVVGFNRRAEFATRTSHADILEVFDKIMAAALSRCVSSDDSAFTYTRSINPRLGDRHWSNFLVNLEDFTTPDHHCNNFLSFAVKCGFEEYVRAKLYATDDCAIHKPGRPLIDYATYPLPCYSPILGGMNPRISKLILKYGADPNESFDGYTPWTNALYTIRGAGFRTFIGRYSVWVDDIINFHTDALETLEALLAGGADSSAQCTVNLRAGRRRWVEVPYTLTNVIEYFLRLPCPCEVRAGQLDSDVMGNSIESCHCPEAESLRTKANVLRQRAGILPATTEKHPLSWSKADQQTSELAAARRKKAVPDNARTASRTRNALRKLFSRS